MKNILSFSGMALLCLFAVACGGGGSGYSSGGGNPPPTPSQIAGKWEIVGTSTQNPGSSFPYAGIEAIINQTGSSISSGNQTTVVIPFFVQGTSYSIAAGDACGDYAGTLSGTVTGNNVSLTLTEGSGANTYVVTGTGTVSSDGKTITGTYSSPGGCGTSGDAGTFSGTLVPSLNGTYNAVFGTGETPSLTVVEDASHNLTVTASYAGTTYTLTGSTVGGALQVSGNVPTYGQTTYLGFYLTQNLVSLIPTVLGNSTKAGDILIFDSAGAVAGLATKQ